VVMMAKSICIHVLLPSKTKKHRLHYILYKPACQELLQPYSKFGLTSRGRCGTIHTIKCSEQECALPCFCREPASGASPAEQARRLSPGSRRGERFFPPAAHGFAAVIRQAGFSCRKAAFAKRQLGWYRDLDLDA